MRTHRLCLVDVIDPCSSDPESCVSPHHLRDTRPCLCTRARARSFLVLSIENAKRSATAKKNAPNFTCYVGSAVYRDFSAGERLPRRVPRRVFRSFGLDENLRCIRAYERARRQVPGLGGGVYPAFSLPAVHKFACFRKQVKQRRGRRQRGRRERERKKLVRQSGGFAARAEKYRSPGDARAPSWRARRRARLFAAPRSRLKIRTILPRAAGRI